MQSSKIASEFILLLYQIHPKTVIGNSQSRAHAANAAAHYQSLLDYGNSGWRCGFHPLHLADPHCNRCPYFPADLFWVRVPIWECRGANIHNLH